MCLVFFNNIKIFNTGVNSCCTEKNTKIKKFKKEQNDLNKTQVTEKTLLNSPSESKFLCLKLKFYKLYIKIYFLEYSKSVNKVEKMQKFNDQVGSSSKSIGKFCNITRTLAV